MWVIGLDPTLDPVTGSAPMEQAAVDRTVTGLVAGTDPTTRDPRPTRPAPVGLALVALALDPAVSASVGRCDVGRRRGRQLTARASAQSAISPGRSLGVRRWKRWQIVRSSLKGSTGTSKRTHRPSGRRFEPDLPHHPCSSAAFCAPHVDDRSMLSPGSRGDARRTHRVSCRLTGRSVPVLARLAEQA